MDPWTITSLPVDDETELRRFVPDDAQKVRDTVMENSDHLAAYMHWMVEDYTLFMAYDFIKHSMAAAEDRDSLGFGIFRGESLIGSIGFVYFDWNAKKTEIGYWIALSEQGKGIVSRASKILIDLAFNELDLNRVEIRCSVSNHRSAAIPRRFGFKQEGLLRQSEFRNGAIHDFYVFGLLRAEWRPEDHA